MLFILGKRKGLLGEGKVVNILYENLPVMDRGHDTCVGVGHDVMTPAASFEGVYNDMSSDTGGTTSYALPSTTSLASSLVSFLEVKIRMCPRFSQG